MKHLRFLAPGLLGLALAGCGQKPGAGGMPPGGMPPSEVAVVTVATQRTEIETELPGRTAAYRIAEVRPQVGGIIQKRLFTEGSDVQAGQQLYQIDPAQYQAAYNNADAAVKKAEAAAAVAKLIIDRRQKLVTSSVISKQDYDDAQASFQQALADVAGARAQLDTAKINLDYTRVTSPIAGRIGRSSVTEGALVTSSQATALAVVQQIDPIYVDLTQSSLQLLRLQRELAQGNLTSGDQAATVRLILEDGTEYDQPGQLQFSEVSVDQGTGSVTLRAVFPNPQRELLPGMFVRAIVKEGVKEDAILLSQRAVSRSPRGEPVALVVGADNRVEQRVLKTDRAIGNQWLVTDGLKPGDRVIVEGVQKTGPGAQVNPVPYTEAPAQDAAPQQTHP